jgi:hypothetical protein
MVENVPKRVARISLPLVIPTNNNNQDFAKGSELAAILCLALSDRNQSKGFFSSGNKEEELLFLAEACYPLWLTPWGDKNLVFDGFGFLKHQVSYDVLPDIQLFNDEIHVTKGTRVAYSAFLHEKQNFFKNFTGKKEKIIDGLILDNSFIKDLISYLPKNRLIRKPMVNKIIFSPTLDENTISLNIQELSNIRAILRISINSLRQTMKRLSTATDKSVNEIYGAIEKTRKNFDKKILDTRAAISVKTREMLKEYDLKIIESSKVFETQLQYLYEEHIKSEQYNQRLEAEIKKFETEIKSSKLNKNMAEELQWKQKRKEYLIEISTVKRKIKELDKKINELEDNKNREISKLREEYDEQIEKAMEQLSELEASRDAEIRMYQQEATLQKEMSSKILGQLDNLLELRRNALNNFEEMGIQKIRNFALVYLPFYLACFRKGLKKRYVIYPPFFVVKKNFLTKIKGYFNLFGSTKINSLLKQRSKSITSLLIQLLNLIREDPVFEKEISDAGNQANILHREDLTKSIKEGLEILKEDEWISEKEVQTAYNLLRHERAS